MHFVRKLMILSTCMALTTPVFAAELSEKQAKNAVEYRQSLFQLVKSNIGPLGAMAKGKAPINEEIISKNALRLEQLGLMISDYFVADTRNNDVSNKASDAIWENQVDFNEKAANLAKASKALQGFVANKDTPNYRKGIAAVGATCKACHDDYKKD